MFWSRKPEAERTADIIFRAISSYMRPSTSDFRRQYAIASVQREFELSDVRSDRITIVLQRVR